MFEMKDQTIPLHPCVICLDAFDRDDDIRYCPDCREAYHLSCWEKVGKKCKRKHCRGTTRFIWPRIDGLILSLLGINRSSLETKCPNCLNDLLPINRYCLYCGADINRYEKQRTFWAYQFVKWVQLNRSVVLSAFSAIVLLFLLMGGVSVTMTAQSYLHNRQTVVALTRVVEQRRISATSVVAQNQTVTAVRILSYTSTPSKTPRPTSTLKPTNTLRPTATRVPFKPYNALPDCAQAQVMIGDIVEPTTDLFIRSSSDNHPSNNIISHLKPGQKAEVIDGPECSWKWMMWKIRRLSDGFEGWVAESDGDEFWLKLAK